jgi:nicotinate-nucleotide pyrophosphorylase (carboxylating)
VVPALLDPVIDRALAEDLAGGDLTSEACVAEDLLATATALAKKPLVVCGGALFRRVFERVDPRTETELLVADGVLVPARTVIWRVRGNARALLAAERTALNFTQRLSGIATLARACVDALPPGSTTRITDTRKTTPGLRFLERYAVRTGGAMNHRDQLGSAVLIKDNHVVAAGGVRAAIERARRNAPHTTRIEVEVDTLVQLDEAIAAGADIIMLDNFDTDATREAVKRVAALGARRPVVEVSGGITQDRIAELAALGVDVISSGALTHSAPAADISLELVL